MKSVRHVHVGTSGWSYPHWKGPFYPEHLAARDMLGFYAERFSAVEINNSFYRLPSVETVSLWCDAVPSGFVFAVKASRYLTHMKKLIEAGASLDNFLGRVNVFGDQLGPVLFQLPPHWRCNPQRLAAFLGRLPEGLRSVFEFRDPSWFSEEVYEVLRHFGAAFCIFELAGLRSPLVVTSDLVYVRLHGPVEAYGGSYDDRALSEWATRLKLWSAEGREVFLFFDNDQAGYAALNALQLNALVSAGGEGHG